MQSFQIEFEAPTEAITAEVVETAQALAQRAADLVETATDAAAEPVPADYVPQSNTDCALLTGEIVAAGTDFAPQTAAETEAVVDATLRKKRSTGPHCMRELVREYVGHILGARTLRWHSNHHYLHGAAFQIRTAQKTFYVNINTEPSKIIVAARRYDYNLPGSLRYVLYGIRREDALACVKRSDSKGRMASSQQVSLSLVKKIELGSIVIPDEFAGKHSVIKRLILLDRIESDLDIPTVKAARAFLAAEPVSVDQPAGESATSVVAATDDVNLVEEVCR